MAEPNQPSKAESPALPENVKTIFHDPLMLRQNFYRDNYRILMYFCYLLVIAAMALMGYTFYERTHKPNVNYYATTNDGKLIKLSPLDEPNLSTQALLDWVVEATTTAYNFNFGNYQDVLKNIRVYFTEPG